MQRGKEAERQGQIRPSTNLFVCAPPLLPQSLQHRANSVVPLDQPLAVKVPHVLLISAQAQPHSHLIARADGDLQVSLEFRRRCPFSPTFHNISGNRPRSFAQLPAELVLFKRRQRPRKSGNFKSCRVRFPKNLKVAIRTYGHGAIFFSFFPASLLPCLSACLHLCSCLRGF